MGSVADISSKPPVLVIVPGSSQNPTHYSYIAHLLQLAGYPTYSGLLPSVGSRRKITAEDDATYIREQMLEPILDFEGHDAIIISHSYSGMPASAAAKGLGRAERTAQGKTTAVIGQIFIASILPKGGDGKDTLATFGGSLPPHVHADEEMNLLRCDDPKPPLFHDIHSGYADVLVQSSMCQCYTSFTSPCPRATWDDENYKGRIAYIRTTNDHCIPPEVQNMMIEGTGQDWIIRDIGSGHCPQVAQPEKLRDVLVGLAHDFRILDAGAERQS